MTHERDIERLLDHWFTDGPTEAPDRVIDVVADRIARQSQRPGWRLDWRHPVMNPALKFGAAIAAIVVIALVGFGLLRGGSTPEVAAPAATSATSPTPSPAASPSGSASACVIDTTGCAGPLTAGDHASAQFLPALSFQTPAGWENNVDIARAYRLLDTGTAPFPEIEVMSQLAIAEQNATCAAARKAGAGTAVQDFIDFLTSHPGLDVTAPTPVDVGGYQGQSVQVRLGSTWFEKCPFNESPYAFLITDTGATPTRVRGLEGIDTMYLTFLDVAGETVVVNVVGPSDKAAMDAVITAAQPVIDSMRFTPAN